jgi:hypothetical protein
MRKKAVLIIFLILSLFFCLGVLFSGHKIIVPSSAMSVTTTFLGYTNDPIEGRIALLEFSNASPISIQREYFYGWDFLTQTGWVGQGTCVFRHKSIWSSLRKLGPILPPKRNEIVAIPAPYTNHWRAVFPYVQPENTVERIAVERFPSIQELGFLTNIDNPDRTQYFSVSGKIDPY